MDLIEKFEKVGYKKSIHIDKYLILCEIQKWLREVHDIHLYIVPVGNSDYSFKYYYYQILSTDCSAGKHNINRFHIYEEALEAGLQEALKLIK